VLAALEKRGVAALHIGEAVVLPDHLHANNADAVQAGPADLARGHGLQEHAEAALVLPAGHDAAQGDALAEGLLVLRRLDDQAANAEHLELRPR